LTAQVFLSNFFNFYFGSQKVEGNVCLFGGSPMTANGRAFKQHGYLMLCPPGVEHFKERDFLINNQSSLFA
jgi:hypothetical protein